MPRMVPEAGAEAAASSIGAVLRPRSVPTRRKPMDKDLAI